jgi:DNA-binding transcriptional regulator LsrR (DeoR family)
MPKRLSADITAQIVPLYQQGYSRYDIAERLGICEPSVRKHLKNHVKKITIEVPEPGQVDDVTSELFKLRVELLKHLRFSRVKLMKSLSDSEEPLPIGASAMAGRALSAISQCEYLISGMKMLDINLACRIVEEAGLQVIDPNNYLGDKNTNDDV